MEVFDPKLDHFEANVIKGVFVKVNLPTTYRKHVKNTFCSSLKLYIGFLSLIVFDPKLDHADAGVINCIITIVNLYPSDRIHLYLHQ